MTTIAKRLERELRPLYERLISDVNRYEGITFFCAQWGRNFPDSPNEGILFVGRAVNSWEYGETRDVNVMFGGGEYALFNRYDQMQWVEDCEGNEGEGEYNTSRSTFWRLIRSVSENYYPDNWSSHVAWSNVCKVAPTAGGNPSESLWTAQLETCQRILEKEIEVLSPRFVVFLTRGDWSDPFVSHLNGGVLPRSMEVKPWGRYGCTVYKIVNTVCICSEHPQGKDEVSHVAAIIELIDKYRR